MCAFVCVWGGRSIYALGGQFIRNYHVFSSGEWTRTCSFIHRIIELSLYEPKASTPYSFETKIYILESNL